MEWYNKPAEIKPLVCVSACPKLGSTFPCSLKGKVCGFKTTQCPKLKGCVVHWTN